MNPLKHIMKPALYLLPWLGLAALTGCSWEEDPATCLPETTSLQVTVSARQEGDLNSRADENAKPGEFMNDLCVLFVQNNVVKLKLQPDLSNDASATAGNLENWTSGEQFLEAGTYTVYAFANTNIDYPYQNWKEDAPMPNAPEEIVLTDPAGKLNSSTRKYIPMAAKEEVKITAATRAVSIGLDRLVAKVRMTIGTTSQENVTVKNVTFSGYADKVSLIKDADISSTPLRNKKYEYTEEFQISASQDKAIPDFYVNETCLGDPFSISVTTTENQGVTYLATTERTELPRNSIYPVELNLNDFGIEITPYAYVEAMGVHYPVTYTPVSDNTYRVELATGSYFTLTPSSVNAGDGNSITDVTWGWTIPSDLPEGYVVNHGADGTVEGHFPAGGQPYYDKFNLLLNAQWNYNGVDYNRTYTFIIDVCHDEQWAIQQHLQGNGSRATDNASCWLGREYLNMYKTR